MTGSGGRGSTVTIFHLEFRYASYIPSLSFLVQTEAEIKNPPPALEGGSDPSRGSWGQQSLFFILSSGMQAIYQV